MATKRKTVATERKRKRLLARELRAKKKRETAQETVQNVAKNVANEPAALIPVEKLTSVRKMNYAELTAYGYEQSEIERRAGISKAVADKLESDEHKFQDVSGKEVNFRLLMEEARATRDGGLDLIEERGLRARAANGDPVAIERLAKRIKKSNGPAKQETLVERIERLRHSDLDLIEGKQARGETLTASDREAMQEILSAITAKNTPAQARETVQISIEKALPVVRRKAFDELNRLLETSTRDDVRLNAAVKLKEWCDAEQPAEEPYVLAAANPGSEKNEPGKPGEG